MPKTSSNESEEGINQYNIDYIYNTYGSVDFGSDIVPSANNTYTLGNSSYYWQTGFITSLNTAQFVVPSTGTLTIKNHLLPDTDNTWDLGSSSKRFQNLYVNNLLFSQISGNTFTSSSGPLIFTTPTVNDPVQISRNLVPSLNNTYTVGTDALKWLAVYGTTVFSNNIDGGGQPVVFNGSVRPISTNVFFLGSSDRVWNQGHITSLFNTTLNTRTVSGNASGDLILTTTSAGNVISVDRHIVPVGTGLTNVGSSTNRYATVFANAVDVPTLSTNTVSSSSGNLLVTTPLSTDLVTVNRDLVPSTNEGNNLGVSGQRWGNIRGASVITNLVGNGASTLSFDSTVAPLTDLTKSVGTPSLRFLDANIGTVNATTLVGNTLTTSTHNDLVVTTANSNHKVSLQRSLLPSSDGTLNLGSAALKYNNVYCNTIHAPAFSVDTISTATSTDLTLTTQSSLHTVKTPRDFTPTVNNTQTLGTTSLRWNEAYATTVFTGTVSNNGTPMLFHGSIRPSADNTYFLGTTGLRFQNGYIRNVFADTVVETPLLRSGTALDLNLTTVTAGNNIVAQRNVLPNANNTLNLGSSSVRWGTLFATTLDITTLQLNTLGSSSGTLTLTTPTASDLILLDRTTTPSMDNTYNLGSATNRFASLYAQTVFTNTINTAAGVLSVTGDVTPSSDNTLSLGSSGQRFTAAHITTLNASTVNTATVQAPTSSNLTLTTTTGTNNVVLARNVLPDTDNTKDIGSNSLRFANVYAANVNATSYNANTLSSVSGNLLITTPLTSNTVTTNRAFTPTVNNTQNLGTSSLKWANVYGTTGFFTTISNNNSWIDIAGGLRPNTDNLHYLGELTKRYQRLYAINTFTDTVASTGTNNLLLTTPTSSQVISCERDVVPFTDDLYISGSTSKRWANVNAAIVTTNTLQPPLGSPLTISGGVGATNVNVTTHMLPSITDSYNFGSSSLLWAAGYFNNAYTNNIRGITGAITQHNSFVPSTNNSINLGTSTLRYNTAHATNVNCAQLQNQSGTEITCTEHFSPATTNAYTLGTSALRWLNTVSTNVYTDTLYGAAANIINVVHDLVPSITNSISLGSVSKYFNKAFIIELTIDTLKTASSSLLITANLVPDGIQNLGSSFSPWNTVYATNLSVSGALSTSIVPSTTNLYDLGSSLITYATGFFNTLRTQVIDSVTGSFIYLDANLIPRQVNNTSLGSSLNWFNAIHSYYSVTPPTYAFAELSCGPITLTQTSLTKLPITITVGPYDAGNNEIKFPSNGFYVISLNLRADTGVTFGDVEFTLYRTNTNSYYGHSQFYIVGGAAASNQKTIQFPYYCGSTADRVEIRYSRGAYNVTNFAFNSVSMVYRITATA